MSKRIILTFIFSLAATAVFAQEGDPIEPEERVESEVIIEDEIDSASTVDTPVSEEIRKNIPSDFLLGVKLNSAAIPSNSEKQTSDKETKAATNKSSYNFLYYLFYKFKKVDNQVD